MNKAHETGTSCSFIFWFSNFFNISLWFSQSTKSNILHRNLPILDRFFRSKLEKWPKNVIFAMSTLKIRIHFLEFLNIYSVKLHTLFYFHIRRFGHHMKTILSRFSHVINFHKHLKMSTENTTFLLALCFPPQKQ